MSFRNIFRTLIMGAGFLALPYASLSQTNDYSFLITPDSSMQSTITSQKAKTLADLIVSHPDKEGILSYDVSQKDSISQTVRLDLSIDSQDYVVILTDSFDEGVDVLSLYVGPFDQYAQTSKFSDNGLDGHCDLGIIPVGEHGEKFFYSSGDYVVDYMDEFGVGENFQNTYMKTLDVLLDFYNN